MGKLTLQECSFNKVDGKSGEKNTLAFVTGSDWLTVACICSDGTIAGGNISFDPFCLWYVLSNLARLISGKHVTTLSVLGAPGWSDVMMLRRLFREGNFYEDRRPDNSITFHYFTFIPLLSL